MIYRIISLTLWTVIASVQAFSESNIECPIREELNYSVSLLCINRELNTSQQYFCEEGYFEEILSAATKWSHANPEARINVWYDSLRSTAESIENSKRAFEEIEIAPGAIRNIQLRDIKEMEAVSRNQLLFSEQMGLWYRIDLLKLIICLHTLESDGMYSVAFADADIWDRKLRDHGMNKARLFSSEIIKKLQVSGMLQGGLENQFLQFIADKDMIRALRLTINVNLMRGAFVFNIPEDGTIWKNISRHRPSVFGKLYNSVFLDVPKISKYFYAMKFGRIEIHSSYLRPEEENSMWLSYSESEHGYEPLGNYYHDNYQLSFIVFDDDRKPIPSTRVIRLVDQNGEPVNSSCLDTDHPNIDGSMGNSHFDIMPEKISPEDGNQVFKFKAI